jgi:hypothetical protein
VHDLWPDLRLPPIIRPAGDSGYPEAGTKEASIMPLICDAMVACGL